ncbi:MAG: hypothetical protein KC613_12095 [Myxococcales bacterium]|nr:hypothetical protein [Myxococcales bacterium]MCB9522934.1 hypothetical protein [Myxococcales bacterium]
MDSKPALRAARWCVAWAALAWWGVCGASPPGECQPAWQLAGAAEVASADESATVPKAWSDALTQVAECLAAQPEACVEIEGQTDDTPFPPHVVAAMGGPQAAQLLRAHGRAVSVAAHLRQLGVAPGQLREAPPNTKAEARGVALRLIEACADRAPSEVTSVLSQTFNIEYEAVRAQRASDSLWWADAGLAFDWLVSEPGSLLDGQLRVGIGWLTHKVYARVFGGVLVGDSENHRVAGEYGGAVGYRPLQWLDVGAFGSHRVASRAVSDGWFEQAWTVGLESAQRLWQPQAGTGLWITESVAPLGQRWRRAEVVDDHVEAFPTRTWGLLRFSLTLSVRQRF